MDEMTLNLIFTVVTAVCGALIILLHILPLFLRGALSRILSYVCLCLHVLLMPAMLFGGFSLEVMILAYVASAFIHALSRYIAYVHLQKKGALTDGESAAEEVSE